MITGKIPSPDSPQSRVFKNSELTALGSITEDVPPAIRARQLREMANAMHRMADRLDAGESISTDPVAASGDDHMVGRSDLAARAGFVLAVSQWRDRCLGQRFFEDQALRVLMVLYMARLDNQPIRLKEIAGAIGCDVNELPATFDRLQSAGYIQIHDDGGYINPEIALAGPALIRVSRFLTDKSDAKLALKWPMSF